MPSIALAPSAAAKSQRRGHLRLDADSARRAAACLPRTEGAQRHNERRAGGGEREGGARARKHSSATRATSTAQQRGTGGRAGRRSDRHAVAAKAATRLAPAARVPPMQARSRPAPRPPHCVGPLREARHGGRRGGASARPRRRGSYPPAAALTRAGPAAAVAAAAACADARGRRKLPLASLLHLARRAHGARCAHDRSRTLTMQGTHARCTWTTCTTSARSTAPSARRRRCSPRGALSKSERVRPPLCSATPLTRTAEAPSLAWSLFRAFKGEVARAIVFRLGAASAQCAVDV